MMLMHVDYHLNEVTEPSLTVVAEMLTALGATSGARLRRQCMQCICCVHVHTYVTVSSIAV